MEKKLKNIQGGNLAIFFQKENPFAFKNRQEKTIFYFDNKSLEILRQCRVLFLFLFVDIF